MLLQLILVMSQSLKDANEQGDLNQDELNLASSKKEQVEAAEKGDSNEEPQLAPSILLDFINTADNMLQKHIESTELPVLFNGKQLSEAELRLLMKEQGISDKVADQTIRELSRFISENEGKFSAKQLNQLEHVKDLKKGIVFDAEILIAKLQSKEAANQQVKGSALLFSDNDLSEIAKSSSEKLAFNTKNAAIKSPDVNLEQTVKRNSGNPNESAKAIVGEKPTTVDEQENKSLDTELIKSEALKQLKAAGSGEAILDKRTLTDDSAKKANAKATTTGNAPTSSNTKTTVHAGEAEQAILNNVVDKAASDKTSKVQFRADVNLASADIASSSKSVERNNVETVTASKELLLSEEEMRKQALQDTVPGNSWKQQASAANGQQASVVNATNPPPLASIYSSAESNASEYHLIQRAAEDMATRVVQDASQTQKSIQTSTEVISILRKDFASALKDKVIVSINQRLQQVDIQLDPPELGNVQVRVNLQNEQASVSFVVQNQQAKEALEQHMSKLREMLNESGVDVGDANVEQQNQQASENKNGSKAFDGKGGEQEVEDISASVIEQLTKTTALGVDFYA